MSKGNSSFSDPFAQESGRRIAVSITNERFIPKRHSYSTAEKLQSPAHSFRDIRTGDM